MTENMSPQSTLTPESGKHTWLWLLQIVTGPLLVILLFIHLIVNHFIGGQNGLLTYTDVVAYYRNPIIPIMEIGLVAVVVTHSLIGLRGILLDLKPSLIASRVIDWVLVIGGISAVSFGIWLILAIVSKGL